MTICGWCVLLWVGPNSWSLKCRVMFALCFKLFSSSGRWEPNLSFPFPPFLMKAEICLKYCDYSNQTSFYYGGIFSCLTRWHHCSRDAWMAPAQFIIVVIQPTTTLILSRCSEVTRVTTAGVRSLFCCTHMLWRVSLCPMGTRQQQCKTHFSVSARMFCSAFPGSCPTGEFWRRTSCLYVHHRENIHSREVHSQAKPEEHFPDLFSSSCLGSIYVPLTIIKYRLFQCKLCEISGLPSYSQRLKLHIFLLTSLHLNFEVWLWKSLAHPCKTNGKTQRAALFGITQGCLSRYYLCLSQSTAKMISLPLKNQSIPFLCTHLPRGKAEQQRYSTPSLF